jgi:gas vesicle structural protein
VEYGMTAPTQQTMVRRTGSSGLYDVLDLILDRGLVIDVFARVSLVGIELLTVDVRVVVASVDTYLRFAEACNRLDLTESTRSETLPEMVGDMVESGSKGKSKGVISGAAEALSGSLQKGSRQSQRGRERQEENE